MPTRKSTISCTMKNIDACWYAIYLKETCKCCCRSVQVVILSCSCTMHMYNACYSLHMRLDFAFKNRITTTFRTTPKKKWEQEAGQLMFHWSGCGLLSNESTFIYFNSTGSHWCFKCFSFDESELKKKCDPTHESFKYTTFKLIHRKYRTKIKTATLPPPETIQIKLGVQKKSRTSYMFDWKKKCTTLLLKSKQLAGENIV